jgi:hypothetical protein
MVFEIPGKHRKVIKATQVGYFGDRHSRIIYQFGGCFFQAYPLYKLKRGFSSHGLENPVKMKFRETGNGSQFLQGEVMGQVGFNVIAGPVDPEPVFPFQGGNFRPHFLRFFFRAKADKMSGIIRYVKPISVIYSGNGRFIGP